jgi:hypothetical protein
MSAQRLEVIVGDRDGRHDLLPRIIDIAIALSRVLTETRANGAGSLSKSSGSMLTFPFPEKRFQTFPSNQPVAVTQ